MRCDIHGTGHASVYRKFSSSLDTHIKYSNLCSHENKIGHKLLVAINKLSLYVSISICKRDEKS